MRIKNFPGRTGSFAGREKHVQMLRGMKVCVILEAERSSEKLEKLGVEEVGFVGCMKHQGWGLIQGRK